MGQDELSACVWLEDGAILHLMWNPGTRIEADNARSAMDAVKIAAGAGRHPLLLGSPKRASSAMKRALSSLQNRFVGPLVQWTRC